MADATVKAAGIAFVTPDGRALFLRRADGGDHAGEWCWPGGGVVAGETPEVAARREAREEAAIEAGAVVHVADLISPEGVAFSTFLSLVPEATDPVLNAEHVAFQWAPIASPPEPLHPGVRFVLPQLGGRARSQAQDGMALDRASVRSFNDYGHLRVLDTNISKAAVNPYLGREIARSEELGLDPDRIYHLLRDPAELEKAVDTFNGVPLLVTHKPLFADAHDRGITVGSISDARFEAPYLKATLTVWDGSAIRNIQNGCQKELSSAYGYWADMTPGTYDGVSYDGVMREIHANHVALVRDGRAGPDVVVGDSRENLIMHTKAPNRAAAHIAGALSVYLRPKLAQDAKLDLGAILKDVTAKNFAAHKPALVLGLKGAANGKLAQDADLKDVPALLDAIEEAVAAEVEEPKPEPKPAADADGDLCAFLAGKLSDEDMAKVREMLPADKPAQDGEGEGEGEKDPPAQDGEGGEGNGEKKDPPAMDTKNLVTRTAMDAAIAAATTKAAREATETVTRTQREIRDAERAVRPYVGDLAVACDSGEAVFRAALTTLGVNVEGVHASAFPTILSMQRKASDPAPKAKPSIAQDAKADSAYAERFPHANRLK